MAWFLLLLHLFLFHFPSFSSFSSFNFSCHHDESSSLLHFKSSFTYSEESLLKTSTRKNGTNCCSWHGVKCDTVSGHVIGLNLGCHSLQGKLHPNSTLFNLVHLKTLNLSNNDFSDSHFHSKFGGFQSLTHLDLSNSYFEGEIPTQISNLSKLQSLDLSWNYDLIWKETTLKSLLQNATDLRELFLDLNDMSSIIPNSIPLLFNQSSSLVTLTLAETGLSGKLKRSLLCLPSIQELDMSWNFELEGQLPELSWSTSLRILDLSNCGFKGAIPTMYFSNLTRLISLSLSFNQLNGSIPSSLLTLPRLTSLDLQANELTGPIPKTFHMSNKLQELYLSDNKIGGELPRSISNLQHLIHLDLSSNSFSGQMIPYMFGGMTKLQTLLLNSNNLEGQIPSSLFNLTQLVQLDCSENKLEGPLSNIITGFQKLTTLRFDNNLINGTIPSSLLSLPSLIELDLSNNQLTAHISAISSYSLDTLTLSNNKLQGKIPESIFNLPNLTELDLSSNNLSGVVNFKLFSKFPDLEILSLSRNSQLSLKFESNVTYSFANLQILKLSSVNLIEFHNLQGEFLDLQHLDLSNNKLNGRMPNWFLENNIWQSVDLSQNLFTSIDQFINVNASDVTALDLSFNLLNGEIPLAVCNISSLDFLNLGYNNLTGIIPQCLAESPSLYVLNLQMNKFHGTLPSNFSKDGRIESLNLYGNQLEGHFPKSMSRCTKLEYLNLGSNRIEDNFPNWLQTLPDLKVLVLRDNKLHGPLENLKIEHLFPSLIIFDISGNSFSGFLPKAYLKNYEAMKNVTQLIGDSSKQYMESSGNSFTEYSDSVIVATKGINITLVKIPMKFVSIDLSRNKFDGEIPNAIGELHALKGLNLSHNRLTGHIPKFIGNLTYLESLDLSSNMLTGVIPAELTNLNGLEVIDLSHNHLFGEIPQGNQFDTFSNDSYEGNLGLCGFPLSKNCGPEKHSPPSPNNNSWSEEKFRFGWKPVAVGYGCGFVIGIGIGYYMFLIGKPRWLVMIFSGQPKRRVTRRTRVRRAHGSTMNQNQMVQMS